MEVQSAISGKNCPKSEISAYADGELNASEELALEVHVSTCRKCLAELNLQKQILSALDFSFDEKAEIELPENFAKVVAIRAESGVCGLRSKDERLRALVLCLALFLIVTIGHSAGRTDLLSGIRKVGEQIFAVANFFAHLIYDLAIGAMVILRSLSGQFVFNSVISIIICAVIFALSAAVLSRFIFRFNRS
ncbi:MAG: anti-sigma factor family protein [Pyrinomonadaceae bacterium]